MCMHTCSLFCILDFSFAQRTGEIHVQEKIIFREPVKDGDLFEGNTSARIYESKEVLEVQHVLKHSQKVKKNTVMSYF